MSYIYIENVTKEFQRDGVEFKALDNINLNIEQGEFVCFLGPSGCGKSTLLNILAGFEKESEGSVLIENKKIDSPRKDRLVIFQDYGLLPWRNVEKNVRLGIEDSKYSKEEKKARTDEYIKLVGLEKFKNHYPRELSGGMQQRVSIARALVSKPNILFMDEPLGALDPITRSKLQDDILKIWKKEKMTIIFVTHDVEEAIYLGTKIVIMSPNPGRVREIIDNRTERKRNDADFYLMKDKILHILEKNNNIEYYI